MDNVIRVLFLCTQNSARSVLAESIMNHIGEGRFIGYSAGSNPRGIINPRALALLDSLGHDTATLASKSWDEFAKPDAPKMDFVFTACDNAAAETCPIWPGHPNSAHWGCPDPAIAAGSEKEIEAAFMETYKIMENRIREFMKLDFDQMNESGFMDKVREIGRL